MSGQPRFFRKNLIDLDLDNASWDITDSVATGLGENFTRFMLNRDNNSGWGTIGSSDAGNTTLIMTCDDILSFNTLILVGVNFKDYSLEWWDDIAATWNDFSTVIDVTNNTRSTIFHQFDQVQSSKVRLIITATITGDVDKTIRQFIVTQTIGSGQFKGNPILKKPTINLSKKAVPTISGKAKILERVGAYSVDLVLSSWPEDDDLTLLEELHFFQPSGFLFWPSAGDETQFRYKRIGYRNEDIFLCGVASEWQPEWEKGIYVNGMGMTVKLIEVV